ncbi:RidA family protein [Streptomyces sp. NPDC014894]|uniref:RidA family protein n=1 Tax=Streptomyces sp. NPDC014894 TaxID=3364931 RepID=UPI0036FCF2D7
MDDIRRKVGSGSPLEPRIGFSRAVRAGAQVAVAGTAPLGDDGATVGLGDVHAQTARCLEVAERALTEAGASRRDVVRTRVMLTDITRWKEAARAHGEWFAAIRPACTFVEVSGFIDPAWLVEVEIDAVVDASAPVVTELPEDEEIAELQAEIARLLLPHLRAPVGRSQYVRGVLPAPPSVEAVRIVTGRRKARTPGDRLLAHEIPLRAGDGLLPPGDITGIVRALCTRTHIWPSSRVDTVMGMALVRVDPAALEVGRATPDDNALAILRGVAGPEAEEWPALRLRGFLFLARDRLRLYTGVRGVPGVTAADVRPSGAITALVAALPALMTEEERAGPDAADPHCDRVVDLTDW